MAIMVNPTLNQYLVDGSSDTRKFVPNLYDATGKIKPVVGRKNKYNLSDIYSPSYPAKAISGTVNTRTASSFVPNLYDATGVIKPVVGRKNKYNLLDIYSPSYPAEEKPEEEKPEEEKPEEEKPEEEKPEEEKPAEETSYSKLEQARIEAMYAAQEAQAERIKQQKIAAADLARARMERYLPDYMKAQGLAGQGISETTYARMMSGYTNAVSAAHNDYADAIYNAEADRSSALGELYRYNEESAQADKLDAYENRAAEYSLAQDELYELAAGDDVLTLEQVYGVIDRHSNLTEADKNALLNYVKLYEPDFKTGQEPATIEEPLIAIGYEDEDEDGAYNGYFGTASGGPEGRLLAEGWNETEHKGYYQRNGVTLSPYQIAENFKNAKPASFDDDTKVYVKVDERGYKLKLGDSEKDAAIVSGVKNYIKSRKGSAPAAGDIAYYNGKMYIVTETGGVRVAKSDELQQTMVNKLGG